MFSSSMNRMFVTDVVILSMLFFVTVWSQPGTNVEAYASDKFFIGVPTEPVEEQAVSLNLKVLNLQENNYFKQFTPAPGSVYNNIGFVKASGTKFTVNGQPYYCSGTNAFYAGLEYIMSEDEVVVMMREQKARGATILRIFTSFFDSVPNSMMPTFGQYNEDALRRLDFALVEMAKRGIRGIIVLSNYWPFLGGFSDWMRNAYPSENRPAEEFYTDAFVKSEWKKFVKMLITRKNSITGVYYYDDPTIFAFELANEPRAQGYDEKIGKRRGETICSWAAEMVSYIRSLDKNHMISIGDEGMRVDGPVDGDHSWINDGYEGVDFVCNLQYADFATVHSYPDAWGMSADGGYQWLGDNYFKDRRDVAFSMNKPIILEEYGMRRGYMPSRDPLFSYIHQQVNSLGYACTLVWAVSHNPSTPYQYTYFGYNDGQGYVFGYTGSDTDGSGKILEQNKYIQSLNPPPPQQLHPAPAPVQPPPAPVQSPFCTDEAPDSQYTCAQQSQWGKCDLDWMKGYCEFSCGRCRSN